MDIETIKNSLSSWAAGKSLIGRLLIFGSRVRGDHRPDSDLDIAIELDLSATSGIDESGGLASWMFETEDWEDELRAILPFEIDLEQYRGTDTPTIHKALNQSSELVYAKAG